MIQIGKINRCGRFKIEFEYYANSLYIVNSKFMLGIHVNQRYASEAYTFTKNNYRKYS